MSNHPSIEEKAREYRLGSNIIRPIDAQAGEVVRIRWRNAEGETLEEDHTAPPAETWKARSLMSGSQSDFYPRSRYGSKL